MGAGLEGEREDGEEEHRGPRVARVVRPWAWLRGMEVGWRVGSSLLKINLLKLRSVLLCEIHLKNVQSRVL